MSALRDALLVAWIAVAHASPSWPIEYSESPDTLPIIQVQLAPPHKPLPEVAAALAKMDATRTAQEKEQMMAAEAAYNASWGVAVKVLTASIDRLMKAFENPGSPASFKQAPTSFLAARAEFMENKHKLTARINLLASTSPAASLESHIEAIEQKRSKDEANIFKQATSEMAGLTQIVQSEVEAQVAQYANAFILRKTPSFLTRGGAMTTNVRVSASTEPFPTVRSLVEGMERGRDASESIIRGRLLELELQLLRAENDLISDRLKSWVEHILQTRA